MYLTEKKVAEICKANDMFVEPIKETKRNNKSNHSLSITWGKNRVTAVSVIVAFAAVVWTRQVTL